MRSFFALTWMSLFLSLGCGVTHAKPEQPPLEFVERVLGAADPAAPLPLLIAIHGLGDSPEAFSELFAGYEQPLRLIAPRAPDPWQVGTSWFPIDDGKLMPRRIAERAQAIAKLASYLRAHRAVRGLPIVTGFSQGGFLSHAVAAYHSQGFASALPIAGMLPAAMPPFQKARADFRVIAFHGRADQRVAFEDDERTVARLKKAGTSAVLTGYAGLGHGVSPALRHDYMLALTEELARLQ